MRKERRKTIRSKQEIIVSCIVFPILFLWSLTLLYPFLWAFLNSLKEPGEFLLDSFSLPDKWLFSNWATAVKTLNVPKSNPLETVGILGMIVNSIWWMFGSVLVNTVVTAMMAYALAKYHYRIGKFLHAFSLVVMTISVVGAFPSQYALYNKLHITNSPAMLLTSAGCIGTSSLLIYYSFFKNISWSYAEAVFIDGGGHMTVLFKIFIPLSLPAMAVMVLYYGVGHWNSWFNANLYLQDRSKWPLQLVLRNILIEGSNLDLGGAVVADYEMLAKSLKAAMVIVTTVPILVIYPFLQKYFVGGMMIGSLKE